MGNYIYKITAFIYIIPYMYQVFINCNHKKKKKYYEIREENDFIEWGQFIELDNYNRDKIT